MLIPTEIVNVLNAVVDVRPSDALVHFVLVDVSEFPPITMEEAAADTESTDITRGIN
jgi:hypothetical protein